MARLRSTGVARGVFDKDGGVLEGPGGVTLTIPPGAIAPNTRQDVYFAVTAAQMLDNEFEQHSSISPPMHHGELLVTVANNGVKRA